MISYRSNPFNGPGVSGVWTHSGSRSYGGSFFFKFRLKYHASDLSCNTEQENVHFK